jgi:hypothetical protein
LPGSLWPGAFCGTTKGKRYESNEKRNTEEVERYREEVIIQLIRNKEAEDRRRVEVVKFIESFPVDIQQRLKTGAFLIDFEGRYYPSVYDGEKSFVQADLDRDYKSEKSGNWKRGLLQTLKAGSPYVTSFLPSPISGVINSFRAELKDGVVAAVVAGNSFSTFGDNELGCSVKFNDNGSEKQISKSFKPF